jgi:hypothetical protein
MSKITFSCDIHGPAAAAPMRLEILCDGTTAAVYDPVSIHDFTYEFPDSVQPESHSIQFVLSGKTHDHTQVDEEGNITEDHLVSIKNKQFECIDVDYAFDSAAVYSHDFNGTADAVEDTFCGIMGCNGRVRFEFTTPIYIWMLENL